jgi:hypothetical protein
MWTTPVRPSSDVAVETQNLKSRWIARTPQLRVDALVALLTAMRPPVTVDVIKRKKRRALLPATRARWRITSVRADDSGAKPATSLRSVIAVQAPTTMLEQALVI